MATIKDVALRAGVSTATVSCHLSGAKPVKPETRIKIDQAIRDLRYIPNAAARQLKKADMKTVGVVMPDFNERLYSEIFEGILEYLQPRNITVNISFSFDNSKIEQQSMVNFAHQNVMGLIVVSCQPENQEFFLDWKETYQIPTIYCLHRIDGIEGYFVGFDNYRIAKYLSGALLASGIEKQQLITGDDRFSTEVDFLRGVSDAYQLCGKTFSKSERFITNMTKENAFKAAMEIGARELPTAVLCSSGQIAKGITEAFAALKIQIPEDVIVITLGEESWNKSEHLHNVIYTTRDATYLGNTAAERLLEIIASPTSVSERETLLQDRFLSKPLVLPKSARKATTDIAPRSGGREIRLLDFLGVISGCIPALNNIARVFYAETGISIKFVTNSLDMIWDVSLYQRIQAEELYDAVLFDTPWKEEFIYHNAIDNISDLIDRPDFPRDKILDCDWKGYFYNGKCYGFPLINGAQTLFYRRDLFDSPDIAALYYKTYNSTLRPPRTWKEYCRIASFFTREYNPASPTKWGVAEMDFDDGSLISQNISRFISAGGSIWNRRGQLNLDTPENRAAFNSMLEPYKYTKDNTFNTRLLNAVDCFCQGDSAMCITFNDGATSLRDAINKRRIGQLGYAIPPEGHSIRAGWGLGIHPATKLREEIYTFLKWFTRTDISYYYTILAGNTTCKLPYENGEILNLYPWMRLFQHGETNYCKRLSRPYSADGLMVSYIVIEKAFAKLIRSLVLNSEPIEEALATAQSDMTRAFINMDIGRQ
ncbi:MAG: extracellular solute-binding protein [Clostridia bacterium]